MSRFDFYTTEAQVDRFIDLTIRASNHRPLWSNRGWTVDEMRHLVDTGAWVRLDARIEDED